MATGDPSITAAEHRAWSYWFADGLQNLVAGLACVLIAVSFALLPHYRHSRSPVVFTVFAICIFVYFFVFVCFRWIVEWLKRRITYPRTGYVAPPYFTDTTATPPADLVMLNLSGVRESESLGPFLKSEDLRWRFWASFAILIAAPVTGRFVPNHLLCVAIGVVGGFVAWLVTRSDPRKAWAVTLGLFFAEIYTVNFVTLHIEGAAYFVAGVGFALVFAGVIELARYLKHNPVVTR